MIKIIENVLKDLAGMQLNIESDVARTWIAEKVEKAIVAKQKESDDIVVEEKVVDVNTIMNVDDVIVSAMESEGYSKGDSGYDFRSGKRDIMFHAPNNDHYEVTFRQLSND
jgi:hypothetical protein